MQLLRNIWAGLPIPAAWNMTQEQFALCKTVLEAAPNKPTWQIQAEFRDYRNEAKSERVKIAIEHMRHIEAKVKQGRFEILTSHRIPTDKLEYGTLMRIVDAREYLQSLGLDTSWLSEIDAPAPKVTAGTDTPPSNNEADHNETLAALFDPVTVAELEKTFSANGQWKKWAERADRNGLKAARQERAKFNPYKAAVWFVRQGIDGWDLASCYRVLAGNLPARSSAIGSRGQNRLAQRPQRVKRL